MMFKASVFTMGAMVIIAALAGAIAEAVVPCTGIPLAVAAFLVMFKLVWKYDKSFRDSL